MNSMCDEIEFTNTKMESAVLPLKYINNHMFTELDGQMWLIDTGAPTSFGNSLCITIGGLLFEPVSSYHNYTAETISLYTGVSCAGLIGVDFFNQFDIIFDMDGGKMILSTEESVISGQSMYMDNFMGIPIITTHIGDTAYRMIFDTGAQISYFMSDSIIEYPSAGIFKDFHFTVGLFDTETYNVPMVLDGCKYTFRCGDFLPDSINKVLNASSTQGIVGNEIYHNRLIGYFPRRNTLIIGDENDH